MQNRTKLKIIVVVVGCYGGPQVHFEFQNAIQILNSNCTDNYDVAKIRMKSVTDHQ